MATTLTINERLSELRSKIEEAAKASGRSVQDIALVAVVKAAKVEAIQEAANSGLVLLGENRVQEAELIIPQIINPNIQWHLVGHLQTNKVKQAVSLFGLIQSVDSVRLAAKINEEAVAQNKIMPVLLEINISGEAQKYGFKPEQIYGVLDEISTFQNLRVDGLMGIAPYLVDDSAKREAFKKLKSIFSACKMVKSDNIQMKTLSMGMSDDYVLAIEEGSNMVRIGRALFK